VPLGSARLPYRRMAILSRSRRLRRELSLLDVYAVATGTTLSAGFFLLPGLAASQAGPALILSYMVAAIPLVPAMFSVVELATAMPRAGGIYYFLDRSLGPMVGTLGGLGTWLAVSLKVAFALVGMGAYLGLFLPDLPILPIALTLVVALGALCLLGARTSGRFQVVLVAGLLVILAVFIGGGLPAIQSAHFDGFFAVESASVLSTAGLVYISYVGVTTVASLAEEVKNPERNLPLGIFLALGTAIVVYALGTTVIVGLVPPERLAGDLTPVATAAEMLVGPWGKVLVSIAAILAFTSVANAGVLSASRYPLAMSRDHLLPASLRRLNRGGIPTWSILLTLGLLIAILIGFNPTRIAKLASAFQLAMFGLVSLAVIVMRESRIDSYDPGYRSPFYPWMQIAGIITSALLIAEMGLAPALFCGGLVVVSVAWYAYYGRSRVDRGGAIFHVFERLGRQRFAGLDPELRSILKEKGLRQEDPFEEIVARAHALDVATQISFEELVAQASRLLAQRLPVSADRLEDGFMQGTLVGMTPVERGVALPHLRLPGVDTAEMVLVRARNGIPVPVGSPLGQTRTSDPVYAVFFLVSPEHDPARHLRLLAQLAGRVEEEDFRASWLAARDERGLQEILLRSERFVSLAVGSDGPLAEWRGRALADIRLPDGCLVAVVRRHEEVIVPQGSTVLQEGDWLTIIGSPKGMHELRNRLGEG
jgi:amino acid transporter/mannitol/fructose-specific phosphotransferase system IIA component (Ntr-type)